MIPNPESRIANPELRKELGVADLTLTQILFIIGLPWVGVAAKQGPAHVVLWLAAIVLFYLPSAAVVIHLNRAMPLEGGLYQWAKLGFNELTGFMVAWNLWLFAILNTSEIGLQITQYFHYVLGPRGDALAADTGVVALVNVVILAALILVTVKGLNLGKWVHKAGGVLMLATFAMLLVLPWLNLAHGTLAAVPPAGDRAAGDVDLQPEHRREDGLRRAGGIRVRGDPRGRVPQPDSRDHALGLARRADHRGDVHPGDELGAGAGPDRADRPDRSDPAGVERRLRRAGAGGLGRAGDDPDPVVHPGGAGERDVRRQHAAADGGRLGRPAAGMVHAPASALPDAGQLDRLRRRWSRSGSASRG